ncbi:hypothetical protein BGZ65_003018 [Modicella reniformis]|uniref:Uncharacterized protein n=1 Tax=Modicella reniformis TaxID=1440133 RepID=A0A9P6LZQ1_9FUNG|nr:hypothetical protein BGZ65_003017 [Modicella reniformis]KAF9956038.1 hypothetical protein BGZ65_003018 [Modicella reniformis]
MDVSSSLLAPQLQDHLFQAAQCAKNLQDRNQEIEGENKKLKQLARDQRASAIDWCSVAKKYQQDRNFMALRLAELELEIAKKVHQGDRNPSEGSVTQAKHHQGIEVDTNQSDDTNLLNALVSQSISEILDHM